MSTGQDDRRNGVVGVPGFKSPCVVESSSNLTLSGEQTIDGVAVVADDRVLVNGQTDGTENGIYKASTGAWTRTKDCNGQYDLVTGSLVFVRSGTSNQGWYYLTTTGTITIGTSSLSWSLTSSTLAVIAAYAQTLLDDTTSAEARTTLELGSAALLASIDEDDMSSDSASALPTQQSVKAYVDARNSSLGSVYESTGDATVTFSGIPAGCNKITLSWSGLSWDDNNTATLLQLGDSGGLETSGYTSTGAKLENGASIVTRNSTAGMVICTDTATAESCSGSCELTLLDSSTNTWAVHGTAVITTTEMVAFSGVKSLSGTLTQLGITTAAGTALTDAGKINIRIERAS